MHIRGQRPVAGHAFHSGNSIGLGDIKHFAQTRIGGAQRSAHAAVGSCVVRKKEVDRHISHAGGGGEVVRVNCLRREGQADCINLNRLRQFFTGDSQVSCGELSIHSGLIGRTASLDIGIDPPIYLRAWTERNAKGGRQTRRFGNRGIRCSQFQIY